jgi:peptide/nickel transport system ATP-binding protein/oligopeptide transport system ATP-binding protein
MGNDNGVLLELKDVKVQFNSIDGLVKAVDGVSFSVKQGETLGIVGESGCGKSVTAMTILRIVPIPPGEITSGEIYFKGENLLAMSDEEIRKIRGNDISMIFQEPMTSLNPVFTIGYQLSEVLMLHRDMNRKEALAESIKMLHYCGIPRAEEVVNEYPFALSGGMKQRSMIAMALACNPQVLIADEPTTALDVTIQAQILELMKKLQREFSSAILFITHDLGVIAEMTDRVIVMYAGLIVEEAKVEDLFETPLHPYTIGLMNSKPDLNIQEKRLNVIPGNVPNLTNLPAGCAFNPRCSFAIDKCRESMPPLVDSGPDRKVRCWVVSEGLENG